MLSIRVRVYGQGLLCWHSIDPLRCPTVRALADSLSSKYQLPPVSIFLRNFLVPDEESIALIREDDLLRLELRSDAPAVLKRALRDVEKSEGVPKKKRRVSSDHHSDAALPSILPPSITHAAPQSSTDSTIVPVSVANDAAKSGEATKPESKQVVEQSSEEEDEEAVGADNREEGTGKKRRRRGKRSRKKKTEKASEVEHTEAAAVIAQIPAVPATLVEPPPSKKKVTPEPPVRGRARKFSESEEAHTTPRSSSRGRGNAALKAHAYSEQQQNRPVRVPVPSKHANYNSWPLLEGPPQVGQRLAFKIMELSSDYTPEISGFKEGSVVAFSPANGVVRIQLAAQFVAPPPDDSEDAAHGRFEMDLDDTVTAGARDQVEVDYQLLIEPRVWR